MTRASALPHRPNEPSGQTPALAAALRTGVATHPGRVRERNEDRPYADPARGIFIVVDGIGGHAAGETAAETALELLRKRLERPVGTPEERIREAIAVANNEIVARAAAHAELQGMGCVTTVAVVEDGAVTVGHVGDSRLYRLRRGRMDKITRDHSPIGEREDRGEIDEREAMAHPRRNVVYRSLGAEEHGPHDPEFADVTTLPFEPDAALLLCSDGLTDLVTTEQILRIVDASAGDPRAVADALVQAALGAGGKDNVSVVYAEAPRFAAEWRARADTAPSRRAAGAAGAAGAARVRGWLDRRWVQFGLGAAFGAAIAIALSLLGSERAARPPLGEGADTRAPLTLSVGPGQRFHTIADALGAARPGDTVSVAAGTYREQVRMQEGVTLKSLTPRGAVLEPTVGPATDGAAVVTVVAEGIGAGRIIGFAIRGTAAAPIDVGIRSHDASVAIEDVEVAGARVAGVVLEGGGAPSLRASWIHDNAGAGVIVRGRVAARLAYNRISDNGRAPHRSPGIDLEPGARAELVGNVLVGNGGPGVRGVTPRDREAILSSNQFAVGARVSRVPVAPAP